MKFFSFNLITVASLFFFILSSEARIVRHHAIPSKGLVAWWKGDGNARDSAGRHDGVLEGGMGFTQGVSGQAFAAGSGKRVYIPDSPDFELSSFTVGAWVNIADNGYYVFFRGDNRTGFDPFALAADFSGNMGLQITADTGESESISAPIPYHEWHHVVGSFDARTHDLRLYIDGKVVAQKTTAITPLLVLDPTQVPGLGIGNTQDGYDFPLLGAIDDVVLYSRALSASEVRTISAKPGSKKGRSGRF